MKAFSKTDVGRVRSVNQDYVFCYDEPIGALSNLFLVADGMGGHQAGDYASRCCVETVSKCVKNTSSSLPIEIMDEAIQEGNITVYREAEHNASLYGMGTTLVIATVLGDDLYVGNVGDSRAYLTRNGKLRQITEDHSWVEEMIRLGELERSEARTHKNKNVITRAIGTGPFVQPDFFEIQVIEGDILLMCTDGLCNMVEDEEILEILSRDMELEEKGNELIRVANANGGRDNIGVVLVQI
ncbi:MAG: Stp1/IreP family PP2C-type Ser/Thr phosphatase [Lachnospiraceae bacterium]|nr:Stp1/IreP family PP2C-type Ser/Thr phosphatase [Lachnospiraceae bacterium]